jgi:hypothetical protein
MMASNVIKKVSRTLNKPTKEIEKIWDRAKKAANESIDDPSYAYIMSIFKKMLGGKALKKLGWTAAYDGMEYMPIGYDAKILSSLHTAITQNKTVYRGFAPLLPLIRKISVIKKESRGNYTVETQVITGYGGGKKVTSAYNLNGSYIGNEEVAELLCGKFEIEPRLSHPSHVVCTIGYIPRWKRWAGWNSKSICSFGIGDMLFEKDFGDSSTPYLLHGSETIKTLKQANLSAKRFSVFAE